MNREDPDVHERRCVALLGVIENVKHDLVTQHMAVAANEDVDLINTWADRIYDRLEAMTPRDLALMVVILLNDAATQEANRQWSALHTMTPEDVR